MITADDIQTVKNELVAYFDDRYVKVTKCDETQKEINKRFANDDKRIDRLLLLQEQNRADLKKNNWLTTAILGVLIAGIIGYIFMNFGG